MRPSLSIKQRLLVLLFLAIVLVLALVGGSLDYLLHRYYKNLAEERFQRLFREVSLEVQSREQRLSQSVKEMVKRDDVISSVNMIYRYSQFDEYDERIFDSEKQKLAQEVRNHALASGIGYLDIYEGNGSLVAFLIWRKTSIPDTYPMKTRSR